MSECDKFEEQLADYAVGAVTDPQRRAVEQHVRTCAHCADLLRALQETGHLLDTVELEQAPPFLWSAVRREIEAVERNRNRWDWRKAIQTLRWPRPLYGGLAGLALALVLAVTRPWAMRRASSPQSDAPGYLEQHSLAAWNDPLADKALAGLVVSLDETSTRNSDARR